MAVQSRRVAGNSARHQIRLLQGGREFFPALESALDEARREVRLETYIFSFDGAGQSIANALIRAAGRGVEVYLTVDGVGTPELPAAWARRFDAAAVSWHVFQPLGLWGAVFPSRWRRLHRKICVVDGTLGFCGGINILDDFHGAAAARLSEPRLDFAVRVTGPLVDDMQETTARFWWRMTVARDLRERELPAAWHDLQQKLREALVAGNQTHADAHDGQQSQLGSRVGRGARANLVLRDNLRNRRRIERAYLRAIRAARHEIVIANAYFLPGVRLRNALVHAAQRGVRVRLLLQGRYEYFLQYHGSRPVYGALLAAGIEIHEYEASYLHAKVAVVDGRWATVGSSNLDPLSLLLAREANIVVRDRDFALQLHTRLEQAIAQGGRRVDALAFASRSWRLRFLEQLAYGAMRLGLLLVGRRY
ncbi:MAG: cardiolipin synthase ClsB [Burkholderiaceae bacterium]